MIVLRWLAIVIALVAIWDPALRASRPQRPPIDISRAVALRRGASASAVVQELRRQLEQAGFRINSGEPSVAHLVVADRPPASAAADVPIWAIDLSEHGGPNVAIRRASAISGRPGESAEVRVAVDGTGVKGSTTELRLEQHGIVLASARHVWDGPQETWTAALHFVPPTNDAMSLVARAVPLAGERTADDNGMDVHVAAQRPPVRVLTYDANVTWGSTFVRRSLEGEPAFSLAGLQRASQGIATHAGAPPPGLSAAAVTPYDVIVVGSPEDLQPRDVEVLRWFVDERGGVAVFVPQRRPSGPYATLLSDTAVDERVLEQAIVLDTPAGEQLRSSELLVARRLAVSAQPLATLGPQAEPVVFAMRRGNGVVIFSGALDAWRSRGSDQQAFARFWRRALSEAASSVPPRLSVEVEPTPAQVGDAVKIRVRLRATELQESGATLTSGPVAARVIGPAQRVDEVVRLGPGEEPGFFEGEWTVPAAGDYDVAVSRGDARGDARITALAGVSRGADADPEGLQLLARSSGGEVASPDRLGDLVASLEARYPAKPQEVRVHPMRSPWWVVPFALALTAEWGWRRLKGRGK
jgi:hypothetical protein